MKRLLTLNAILMICGAAFGIIAYFCLSPEQTSLLQQYLGQSLSGAAASMKIEQAVQAIFQANGLDLLRLYFLGICLLGLPLIFLFLFVKGFTLGFLCCFLFEKSLLLVLIRGIYFPVLAFAATYSCRFSSILLTNQISNPLRQLTQYTIVFLVLLVLFLLLSYCDALISCRFLQKFV